MHRSQRFMLRCSLCYGNWLSLRLNNAMCVQDLRGVTDSIQLLAEDPQDPIVLPDGFVKIIKVLPARANATQGK